MRKQIPYIISLVILLASLFVFISFLAFHEQRVDASGWLFNDPVFDFLPRMNCSIAIFSLTYGSLVLYALLERKKPLFLTKLNLSYALLLLVRMVTLTLIPLREPNSLIYLEDPFLNDLIYPGQIDADLFFSGHTALLFIFFSISRRYIFALFTIVLAFLLMIQRVHYSIDVLAALPFAFGIVFIIEWTLKQFKVEEWLNLD